MRIGFGYDVHRLVEGRPLVLGGVHIPFERGLLGHSDADVLLHAVADALLGAAALGDLGALFPDTDPKWKDANSADLLGEVVRRVADKGFSLVNVDATVVAERPKLRGHIDAIRERMADILGLARDAVSVKATTQEQMDTIGAGDGMAAYAVCLLE